MEEGKGPDREMQIPVDLLEFLAKVLVELLEPAGMTSEDPLLIPPEDPAHELLQALQYDGKRTPEISFADAAKRIVHLIDALDEYMENRGWDVETFGARRQLSRKAITVAVDEKRSPAVGTSRPLP